MEEQFVRTAMLLGQEGIERLQNKKVAVFGIGGVGGHAIEALARSGVGFLDLIDNDVVSKSNINRQIIATHDTVGRYKTEVMRERIQAINPRCKVRIYNTFYLPDLRDRFPFAEYDYIVDAIDTVTAKIDLALAAWELSIPIISSMGTGNKLNPSCLEITDIYKTSVCPLAKVMRRELKKRGVKQLKVVYSREAPLKPLIPGEKSTTPGSTAFVPAVAGLMMAGEVVRALSAR